MGYLVDILWNSSIDLESIYVMPYTGATLMLQTLLTQKIMPLGYSKTTLMPLHSKLNYGLVMVACYMTNGIV
jgi:hypothetical protein